MTKRIVCMLSAILVSASPAWCQKWEFGGAIGGGFYTSTTVQNTAGNGTAKIGAGLTGSAWLANNSSDRWGGELRYDFQRGPLQIKANGASASFAAMSHSIHYDLLLHFAPRESSIRPFVAFGGGVKMFQGTGAEVAAQPLSRLALLTRTTDLRPLVSIGAGVKAQISERWTLRAGVWDFFTPFPSEVIVPNAGSSVGGWMHDFVPMIGLGYSF